LKRRSKEDDSLLWEKQSELIWNRTKVDEYHNTSNLRSALSISKIIIFNYWGKCFTAALVMTTWYQN
jgi:hypothetical protein